MGVIPRYVERHKLYGLPHFTGKSRGPKIALLGLLACLPITAFGQNPVGNPVDGRAEALELCTQCHLVAPDQPFMSTLTGGPAFHNLSNAPGTIAWLRDVLTTAHPHPKNMLPRIMPMPKLSPKEVADVISYIIGLRGQGD